MQKLVPRREKPQTCDLLGETEWLLAGSEGKNSMGAKTKAVSRECGPASPSLLGYVKILDITKNPCSALECFDMGLCRKLRSLQGRHFFVKMYTSLYLF